jgi:hypothetical protein
MDGILIRMGFVDAAPSAPYGHGVGLFTRLKARFRSGGRDPVIGLHLDFRNDALGVDYRDKWPHAVFQRMKSDRRDPMALAEHIETEIKMAPLHGRPYLEFSGGPVDVVIELMAALEEHDFAEARRILGENPGMLAGEEEWSHFPLLATACTGDAEGVQVLLEDGARVDATDDLDMSPLHWSAAYGHEAVVHRLLEHGADPEQFSVLFMTAADLAHLNGHAALSEVLAAKLDAAEGVGSAVAVIRRMATLIAESPPPP